MEFASNPTRNIEIKTTGNAAYLVHVGCQYFAYADVEKLIADLSEYLRDPKGVEEQYNKHFKAYDECVPESPRSLGSMVERVPEPEEANGATQSEATEGY